MRGERLGEAGDDLLRGAYGAPSDKIYNDWAGIKDCISLPDEAWHRNVDKIVLAGGSDSVKTAIVCPPTIYGPGRGPDNQRSDQLYKMAEAFMKRGKGFYVFSAGILEVDPQQKPLRCYILPVRYSRMVLG